MSAKLFAVYLGGRAARSNTELHDVVFVVGEIIEDTYEQLLEKWFGIPSGLHIDSWIELDVVDGYQVRLSAERSSDGKKLFFVNLGAYLPGEFTELHANAFIVAESEKEVKARAKKELLTGMHAVHTDDLYDIDDCLEVSAVGGLFVSLSPALEKIRLEPNNGYHIIPKKIVAEYERRIGFRPEKM